MVDALALRDDEGRGKLRKAAGSCKRALIRRCPNGETHYAEGIVRKRKRGELKHLSTRRKRNQRDSLSSGERKGKSPKAMQ